jgi:hypothetical protein
MLKIWMENGPEGTRARLVSEINAPWIEEVRGEEFPD